MVAHRVVVRYTVKAGNEQRNEELVRDVYRELAEVEPENFRYATFRLDDDGRTFVHIASAETEDGHSPLLGLPAFRRFQEGIEERCEWGPVVSEAAQIGAFRAFEAPRTKDGH